jgi:branched-chain amino acid transport system substrate-binding protein
MSKHKTIIGGLLAVSILLAGLAGCQPKEENVLRVGVILPMTGTLSVMGQVEREAMSLALEKVNAKGKKMEIYFEDGKGTPTDAVSAARKLIDLNKVDVLITSTTGASLAVEPIATQNKKNLVAFCMDPDVAKKSDYVIRYYEGIDEEAAGIMKYFNDNSAQKTVGILYAKVPVWEKVVNNTLLPFLKSKNLPVPYVETYALNEKDFKTVVLKMKDAKIDHLILLGYGFEYPGIFKPMSEYELLGKMRIIGGWGFLYTPVEPTYLNGVLVSGPEYVFKNHEFAGQFYNEYHARYSRFPNFDAAFAYNAIMSLGDNMNRENASTPIKQIYADKSGLTGVAGPYSFDANGNMIVTTGLGMYQDGKITEVTDSQK